MYSLIIRLKCNPDPPSDVCTRYGLHKYRYMKINMQEKVKRFINAVYK